MRNSVEFYMAKGLDRTMAEYFSAGRKTIVSVIPSDDFTLLLTFDNGEKRQYDVKPLIQNGTIFECLKEKELFQRVYLDDANCVAWDIDPNVDSKIVWNNKIDLCPDSCYVDSILVR